MLKGGVYLSTNSNNVNPILNAYTKSINSIIKASTPVIDTSVFMSPFIDSFKASINLLNESVNFSVQPLVDHLNDMNNQITSSMNKLMSNIATDSLKNFKTITSYSLETIESINKFSFEETIDDLYVSLDDFEFNDEIIPLATECKNEIISVKNDLSISKSKEVDIHQWIATILAIASFIIAVLTYLDKSSEKLSQQQQQTLEYHSSKLESIDESFKKLIESQD